jgi:hypothetical protein
MITSKFSHANGGMTGCPGSIFIQECSGYDTSNELKQSYAIYFIVLDPPIYTAMIEFD